MNNALKEVKTIKDNSKITDCLLLQDGRIALSSDYIKIYDIVTAKCNITIKEKNVITLCQIDNGNLISGSLISINFWKIEHNVYQNLFSIQINITSINLTSFSIISLSNNKFALFTLCHNKILLYEGNQPYSAQPYQKLVTKSKSGIISVLFIKKKNLLLSSTMDNNLYFWMLSTFQCISIMTDIFCCKKNSMCLIDDDRVIIGRKNAVSIVNITKCNRQDKIINLKFGNVNSMCKLNKELIVFGCKDGCYCVFNANSNKYNIIASGQKKDINTIIKIKQNTLLCTSDNNLKILKK